ncbi:MAG TPA: dihydrofolate reductase [Candidatus Paceibacterota bacterium]|nr:dihydrofolate reductase [Candidatus Paceibacterota bacterium]
MLSMIAAIGKNKELGKGNTLLWDLPLDMKHFRSTTSGHPVIMGQRTFESIGRPLPKRRNIILTRDREYHPDGTEIAHSIEEAIALLDASEENFVVGGGQIYTQFLEKADRLYLTEVDADFPDADAFFPEFIKDEWKVVAEEKHEKDAEHQYDFVFKIYERK